MDPPLRTSTVTSNSRALSYGQSTKYLEPHVEVMIECVEMREESSSSFAAL